MKQDSEEEAAIPAMTHSGTSPDVSRAAGDETSCIGDKELVWCK